MLAQEPSGSTTTAPTTTTTTTSTSVPEDGSSGAEPGEGASQTTVPDTAPQDDFRDPAAEPEPVPRESLVPPPIDLTSLEELLSTKRAEAVATATAAADAANAEALANVADLQAALDDLTGRAESIEQTVRRARAGEREAAAGLERARDRRSELAVESYTLALSGSSPTHEASADLLVDSEAFERFVRTSEYSGAAWGALEQGVGRAEAELEDRSATTAEALAEQQRLDREIGRTQATLDAAIADAHRIAAEGEEMISVAAATGDDLAVDGLGPTILGETILSAEDLAAFSARRSGTAPSVDLLELAQLFVLEGTAEGVRADIAWAQSILETGNFGYRNSMVSTSDHNYAGIGACDSCSSGFRYDSPQMGVRAQMQLLHTYADDNLTSDDLAFPPAGRTPERSSVRGCCDTWMELSGVWATGPGYGVKILTIYNEMLAFAAQRQRDAKALEALLASQPPVAPETGQSTPR